MTLRFQTVRTVVSKANGTDFVGFLPDPMPGQTIEDIARAEAVFLERVIELHPDADGKPCVVGNCQAGWAVMMLAAIAPHLFGPIIVAGSPLSYWTGQRGLNPMRYTGGLLGGSWLTAFTSDIGHRRWILDAGARRSCQGPAAAPPERRAPTLPGRGLTASSTAAGSSGSGLEVAGT